MTTFVPYPDINDDNFYDVLFAKKEFNKTAYGSDFRHKTSNELCSRGEFKMQNHQEFVRNFISPETPYNGILLFHGTGVGKTCAAIGATEGLRDYVSKNAGKIYILSSENIRPNFYKELYDPNRADVERDIHGMPGSYQCAGDRYYPAAGVNDKDREAAVNAMIKEHYSFFGFGSFANFVDIRLGANLPSYIKNPLILNDDGSRIDIGDYFANSVIVIDEAHGIATNRTSSADGMDEQEDEQQQEEEEESRTLKRAITNRSLFQVLLNTVIPACLKKGAPIKLILLSATPMKDNILELANLLQLLNVNDQRMTLDDTEWRAKYFPKMTADDNKLTEEMIAGIKKMARGYISYVKSNNPITFPKPLIPPMEYLYEPARDSEGNIRPMYSILDAEKNISSEYDIKLANRQPFRFELVKCPMSLYHFKCYMGQVKMDTEGRSKETHMRMASNLVFPHKDMAVFMNGEKFKINPVIGNKGFDACFQKKYKQLEGKTYEYYKYTTRYENFLKQGPEGLEYYSKKFDTFLNFVNNDGPKGVVYAYSEFVKSGALMGALVLEANGYVRYTPNLEKYLDKNGLPVKDIQDKNPQSHMLHMTIADTKKHYRCARCGQIFNKCRENPDKHEFKVGTYLLVTAAIGSISDIAAATSNNKDGSKIRVVMGTKTTGQGVDFKWVRQVHILDPWHNNTRIYQAIGRGLRHCSHADLPVDDRTVTIYRYSSAPPEINLTGCKMEDDVTITQDGKTISLNLKYRDFYTETIDERMYQRVVQKDLVIKQIERVLKTVAIDCELNRMRNYFPNYDVDYSRECDYTLCKYDCDGFLKPIKYIRRIRREEKVKVVKWFIIDDEDTPTAKDLSKIPELLALTGQVKNSQELWDALKTNHMLLQKGTGSQEIIVDLPLLKVDQSTYDIYFSGPQVDRAMKIITRIYHKSIAHSLDRLVYLVKLSDPGLELMFIYEAIDKLVGNLSVSPVTFVDRYGRKGHLIYHNGYYIYQPAEIKDKTTPLYYRMRPLDIKRRFFNMDELAPKQKAVTYAITTVNTQQLDDFMTKYVAEEVSSVLNLLEMYRAMNNLMLNEHKYILEQAVASHYNNNSLPGSIYVIEYYLRSGILMFKDWNPETGGDLLHILTKKDVMPFHFISSDSNVQVYELLSSGEREWHAMSLSDVYTWLPLKENELFYPAAPSFSSKKSANRRKVFTDLNTNTKDSTGIYGFRSAGKVTRNNKPIIASGSLAERLKDVINTVRENYKDEESMKKNLFKVLDETTKQTTMTKGNTQSGRTALRGLACTSSSDKDTQERIDRLMKVIEDNYEEYFHEEKTYAEFMRDLNEKIGRRKERNNLCNQLELLMILVEYYQIDNKKWYLNTIETEFYRPTAKK